MLELVLHEKRRQRVAFTLLPVLSVLLLQEFARELLVDSESPIESIAHPKHIIFAREIEKLHTHFNVKCSLWSLNLHVPRPINSDRHAWSHASAHSEGSLWVELFADDFRSCKVSWLSHIRW